MWNRLKKSLRFVGIHFVEGCYQLWPRRGLILEQDSRGLIWQAHLVLGFIGFKRDWHENAYRKEKVFCRQMHWIRIAYETHHNAIFLPILDKRRFSFHKGRTPMCEEERGAKRRPDPILSLTRRNTSGIVSEGDLCDQPGCPYYGAGADPKPDDFPPCPHMAEAN